MLWSLGHSNRSAEDFLALLRAFEIQLLVDVRRYPSSRRHPWFNRPALAASLDAAGIRYRHDERLGGHRQPRPDSPNTALEDAWRGYADHMASRPFRDALAELEAEAQRARTAVMCAEADPGRCHRLFLADAVTLRGGEVVHILGPEKSRPHELHPAARLLPGGRIVYPDTAPRQMALFPSAGGS